MSTLGTDTCQSAAICIHAVRAVAVAKRREYESQVGMMTFPVYGKIKVIFQSTNQRTSASAISQDRPCRIPPHQWKIAHCAAATASTWGCRRSRVGELGIWPKKTVWISPFPHGKWWLNQQNLDCHHANWNLIKHMDSYHAIQPTNGQIRFGSTLPNELESAISPSFGIIFPH